MTDIEDRLRDAYRGATQVVRPASIRTLGEQSAAISWPAEPADRLRSRRWVAAFAAAAAVVVIAAGAAAVVPHLLSRHRPSQPVTSSRGGQPGRHGQAAKHNSAPVPPGVIASRYAVAISADGGAAITVHRVPSGQVAGRVATPGAQWIVDALATGDGATYVVAAGQSGVCGTSLFEFTLDGSGQPSKLTPFSPDHIDEQLSSIALSADGKSLAYWGQQCGSDRGSPPADLGLVNLTTQQTKLWSLPGQEDVTPLYLSADGSLLGYSIALTKLFPSAAYLLHTSSPAGRAATHSKLLVQATQFGGLDQIDSTALTPDGKTMYFTTNTTGSDYNNKWQVRYHNNAPGHRRPK